MNRDADLQRAFELIENDSLDEARAILDDILASDQQNADAWWLYAHAVTETDQAQRALNNVIRADPNYPGAKELLDTLDSTEPARPAATGISRLGTTSTPALTEDDDFTPDFLDDIDDDDLMVVEKTDRSDDDDAFDFDDDDEAEDEEDEETGDGRRRILLALIALVVLVAAVFVVFVLKPFQPASPSGTPTQVVSSGSETPQPTAPIIVPATETLPPVPEQGLLEGVYNALSGVALVEDSATVEQTSSGSTLAVLVCAESRRALRTFVPEVMKLVAAQGPNLEGRYDAVGVRFLNCNADNSQLLYVVLRTADAAAFANGSLSEDELEARFVSVSQ